MENNSLNPNDPYIKQNLSRVKSLLDNKNITTYFVASPRLRQVLKKQEHPFSKGIVDWIKFSLIEGKGVIIQKRMVWEYLNNTLDEKNTWLFKNGDIRINWTNDSGSSPDIVWEDISLKNDVLKKE